MFLLCQVSDSINEFVKIEFDALLPSIRCVFQQPRESEKLCSIIYGPGQQCTDLSLTSEGRDNNLDSAVVVIDNLHLQNESLFCSIVTASDGTWTASIEKIFHMGIHVHIIIANQS
jgi:hypothetical protein